jgi:hypothetical protein
MGDYFGNNNYQQGGDKTYASDWGLSGIEHFGVQSGRSASGTYSVVVYPPANSSNANESVASTYNNVTLKWLYAANGVEVANNTNLSAESLRVFVIGV